MSEIKVENQIVMKRINEVKPYVRNPRKNDRTVALLMQIIPKVGFNVPIVIDENGIIVKGHARFAAAIKLGMKEVPCIITHASPEAIKADRIADNKISEFSEWVNEELMHELDSIDFDFDFSELGFPKMDIDMPSPDEFDVTHSNISDEERRRLYQEFLEQQQKESAQEVTITTQADIDRAKAEQVSIGKPTVKYYKMVCEKCGHVMFVREGDLTGQ